MLSYGKIVQVSGPVVDCEFQEGQLPKIREALRVQVEDEVRTMEVAQHMDEHTVRCIMLAPSEGLSRGMTVEATGRGISVPVGDATLGRMFNVLGDPIDGGASGIHRKMEHPPPSAVLCRAKPGREHSGNRHQGH